MSRIENSKEVRMHDNYHWLALIHQKTLLDEVERERIARRALAHNSERQARGRVSGRIGLVLIHVGQRLGSAYTVVDTCDPRVLGASRI